MSKLWIVLCEIAVTPGDLASGSTLAFSNVVTWGESGLEAQAKIRNYLSSFAWNLISCERIEAVRDDAEYSQDVADLIERGIGNPDAILLGKFFSYDQS